MTKKEKKIEKKDIASLLTKLANEFIVFAPVKKKDAVLFEPITDAREVSLDFTNTRLSAKHIFFPQCEKMMTFTTDPEAEDAYIMRGIQLQKQKRVIFGLRPCDAKSFIVLDTVFNQGGKEFEDPYYLKRREETILIGIGCNRPLSSCFCTLFNKNGPFAKEGVDMLLTDIGDSYVVSVLSEKGEELLKGEDNFVIADSSSVERARQIRNTAKESVKSSINLDIVKSKSTKEIFDDSLWDVLYETCIGCGICAYSCPTCHCFDMQDEITGAEGVRMRNWDSCMFSIYTQQASGHNPRPTKKERFRQRFMHKFKYFHEKFNMISCVGCGRCIQLCPVNIDIRQVIQEMNEQKNTVRNE